VISLRKRLQIGDFTGKTFADCLLLSCQRTLHPRISQKKTFVNSHKIVKFVKVFSLSTMCNNTLIISRLEMISSSGQSCVRGMQAFRLSSGYCIQSRH